MDFKEPLLTNQLCEIQDRNRDSADVRALLWEMTRLRAVVLYADQLQRIAHHVARTTGRDPRHAPRKGEGRAVREGVSTTTLERLSSARARYVTLRNSASTLTALAEHCCPLSRCSAVPRR